ncbi:MAG: cupin domain-containing protein [Terriglobales bacterium]
MTVTTQIIDIVSAEHYKWGGSKGTDCDGWHLVKTPELSVIEELIPSGRSEARHSHRYARQFFYVLDGELTMEVGHRIFTLRGGQGIEVSPGQEHQALNKSASLTRLLVISQPPGQGDRLPA